MVLIYESIKTNACRASAQFRPKEIVTFDSQYHMEFKKRYQTLVQEQNRPKTPIKLIIIMTTMMLCVLNVFWNLSIHNKAVQVVEVAKKEPIGAQQVNQGMVPLTNLRGSTYVAPHVIHLNKGPTPRTDIVKKVVPIPPYKPVPLTHKPRPQSRELAAAPEKKARPPLIKSKEQTVPIYFVNLDRATDRREYIEAHLEEQHLKAVRVGAMDNLENVTVSLVSPLSLVNPNNKEIACIASHLVAIHKAVNDKTFFPNSPYAIIIEDDVKFEFPINWNELFYNAPEDFDVLQLMTSNSEQVAKMAEYYDNTVTKMIQVGMQRNISNPDKTKYDFLWELRLRGTFLWSTQAYAVLKDHVRETINKMVTKDEATGTYQVNIKNTPNQLKNCKSVNAHSCKLLYPFRLVADIYLYDLLGDGYTLRLPLFNGVSGYNSSIQAEHVDKAANTSFTNIGGVVSYVRKYRDELLPTDLLLDV